MKSLKYDGICWSQDVHDIRAEHNGWPTGPLHGFLRLKMGTNGILIHWRCQADSVPLGQQRHPSGMQERPC